MIFPVIYSTWKFPSGFQDTHISGKPCESPKHETPHSENTLWDPPKLRESDPFLVAVFPVSGDFLVETASVLDVLVVVEPPLRKEARQAGCEGNETTVQ